MMLFLGFFKGFLSSIISFANTKLGKIVIGVILAILSLYLIHNHGYKSGVESEKNKNKELIAKAVMEQIKRSEIEKIKAIELIESQKKTEIIYEKVKDKVNKIKEKNPNLSKKENSLPIEDQIKFNQLLDEIK